MPPPPPPPADQTFDYDWIVIGSGFGGSVAALRLAEKGYRVLVLESGRRFRDEDFAKSTWDTRRYFFAPKLGCRGVMRMSLFRDIFIVSGAGVGGGSLGYANTLYRARRAFFEDPSWRDLADWEAELTPHYDTAERVLGVTDVATGCCRRWGRRSASATATGTPASACTSGRRASRTPTPTSAARARPAPAARAAASA